MNQIFVDINWRTSFHIYNLFITYNFTALRLFLKIAKNYITKIGTYSARGLNKGCDVPGESSRVPEILLRKFQPGTQASLRYPSYQRRLGTECCTAPEMNPTPKWSPNLKWSPNRPRNDSHFSSRRPGNDPQLILGIEWYSVTELLQVCCSIYVLESHFTFHYTIPPYNVILCKFWSLFYFIYISVNSWYLNKPDEDWYWPVEISQTLFDQSLTVTFAISLQSMWFF